MEKGGAVLAEDKRRVSYIRIVGLVTAVCLMGDSMLYIALPVYWQEVGLASLWEVGILLSVNRLVRLPLSPVVGWLYTRMSKRTGLVISVLLAACSTLGYGLFSGFAVWIVLRCLWGVAWTFLRTGAYLTIIDLSHERNRGSLLGTYNGIYRLGSLIGMLVGGGLAGVFGIRPVAIVLGLCTLLSFLFVMNNIPIPSAGHGSVSPVAGRSFNFSFLRGRRDIVFIVGTGLLFSMFCEGMFTATLSHLIQVQHSTVTVAGVVIEATMVSGFIQALRWSWGPWLAPWFGGRFDKASNRGRLLSLLIFGEALFFACVPLDWPFFVWLGFILGILLMATFLTTAIDALVSGAASTSEKVAVVTFYTLALDVGAALGPVLGYSFHIYNVFWLSAAVLALLASAWFMTSRSRRQTDRSTAA